ncbi:MAG TPA: tRNA 2-thiouridine(34) synthase MnmA [Clostridia bacterium]|nr:tRNA 2-thiouridine(34) synthase MnmA [Clostridia bacterium]
MMPNQNKVAVAMSGGIDSSVTAFLLKRIGYEVVGVTMHLYDEIGDDGLPRPQKEIFQARKAAESLGIPHHVADFRPVFDWVVKSPFAKAYAEGRTPNPCMECNKQIKYGKLLEYAMEIGAYYLATGHYASVEFDEQLKRYRLYCAKAENKDQSYLLNGLGQGQLSHLLLPLGDVLSKDQVRETALEMGIYSADKKDSKDICFVTGKNYIDFVETRIPKAAISGEFVDTEGNVLGMHNGIARYTIGQRKGLGHTFDRRYYVVSIDSEKNRVVLGEDSETYASEIHVGKVNLIPFDELQLPIKAKVRICQWGWLLEARIFPENGKGARVVFDKPERAPAPGQWAVFYRDGEVLGGGIIKKVIREKSNE